MPAFHIERSIVIDATKEKVLAAIEDYHEWPVWSPWLIMERGVSLTYTGSPGEPGHGYDWDGDLVGAGGMRLVSNDKETLMMDLSFLRPMKSTAKVRFQVESLSDSQTKVVWQMDGKMPFFLFFLIGMMQTMIGMDYERGLRMLKEYVETGSVNSSIEIVGIVDVPELCFAGVDDHCSLKDMSESMCRTLPAAHQLAVDNQINVDGMAGAIYHKFDMKNQECHYTGFVPVSSQKAIDGGQTGIIEACRALKVVHTGSYSHLGNGWSAAMSYQRHKKLKTLKTQSPFELYLNDPEETPETELLTEIFIPIRG